MPRSVLLLASLLVCASAQAFVVDFSGASDLANNFRKANTASSHTLVQSGTALNVTSHTGATTALVYVYDTTPADATGATQNKFSLNVGDSISVSMDIGNISSLGAGTSLGFYFANPNAQTSAVNYYGIVSVNNQVANEQFRFGSGAALNSTQTNGTLVAGTPQFADGGLTVSDPVFRTVKVTYQLTSLNSITMTSQAGSATSSITYSGITPLNEVAVAFRISPSVGATVRTMQLDNFEVTVVPEPSTYAALAGVLGLGAALFRRSRSR